MSAIEFVTYIEIPIRVFAEHQKAEHATLTYPGCPATIGIDDIEICTQENHIAVDLDDLKNHILEKYNDDFEMESWEHQSGGE